MRTIPRNPLVVTLDAQERPLPEDRRDVIAMMHAQEPVLKQIWDNPEDEIWNDR